MTLIYTVIYLLKLLAEFCLIFIGLLLWIPCAILSFIGKLFAPIANDLLNYFRNKTIILWLLICASVVSILIQSK